MRCLINEVRDDGCNDGFAPKYFVASASSRTD